mmetsp:Transcript_23378/g.41346  ORF Transcript_23378/g.41346 Transcript_23378/m.41346 type:complete len:389 (-) Transcript_23378:106-1272(-)
MADVEVSAVELMANPDFVQMVDEEWEKKKNSILSDAKKAKAHFKGNIPDRYVEALKIHLKYEEFKKNMQWDNAFYCLHLYLECVLSKFLHRPQKQKPFYTKQAADVLETLQTLEEELDYCMRGIRSQIIEALRREEQARREEELVEPPNTVDELEPEKPKAPKFTAEEARKALDALRMDGKTSDLGRYGVHLPEASSIKPPVAPSVNPPPSYKEATGGRNTSRHEAVKKKHSLDLRVSKCRIKKVLGDGSCAFRSIAQSSANGRLSQEEEAVWARDLRRTAASELRKCANEEMTGTGLTVEQITLMKDSKFPTFNEYINAMSRSEYAGETEFWLLARKLKRNIAIYQPKGDKYEHLMTYGNSRSEPAKLLWQRGATEAGNHYDAIITA